MFFKSSVPFKDKFSDHFKDLRKLKLLTDFDTSRRSNEYTFPPGKVGLTANFSGASTFGDLYTSFRNSAHSTVVIHSTRS